MRQGRQGRRSIREWRSRWAGRVLLHGVLGGVGSLAAQLAHWAGATVIATVRRTSDLDRVDPAVAHAIALDTGEPAAATARTRRGASTGSSRSRCLTTPISTTPSPPRGPSSPPTPPARTALRSPSGLCCSTTSPCDDFPAEASQAARNVTSSAAVGDCYPLDNIAKAHDHVDAGGGHGRIPHSDTAVNNGRYRHPVSFLRVREDLTADQLPRFGA